MITCIGEMILDIMKDNPFSYVPGGAPYNVIKRYVNLGNKGYFCSVIGNDEEGKILKKDISLHKNIIPFIDIHPYLKTGVSYVTLDNNGDRHFLFKKHRAYEVIKKIPIKLYSTCNIFHFSSLPLTTKKGQRKMLSMIKRLENMNKTICFDINLRSSLFSSNKEIKKAYQKILPHIDILKMSEEEKDIFTPLLHTLKKSCLLFITKGEKGADVYYQDKHIYKPSIPCKCINTLGAGDAFFAGVLYQYEQYQNDIINHLDDILFFAIAMGSYAVSHQQDKYPNKEELNQFMKSL